MIGARPPGAVAIGDAGLRDLPSEFGGPRPGAARGDGRAVTLQESEDVVRVRREPGRK